MAPPVRLAFTCLLFTASGCGDTTELECTPPCPAATHCTENGCVSDSPDQPVDLAMAAPPDFAGACAQPCAAPTPHCQSGRCVPCLMDSHCPAGQICKQARGGSVCAPGCADDARCGGGSMKCCAGACLDTSKDPQNCGACGMGCGAQNSRATCAAGQCVPGACNDGWGDCNMSPADGCETSLRVDPKNCTACGMTCAFQNAIAGCSDGCYIAACNFGFDDCNGKEMDGCETSVLSDIRNCGGCGMPCAQVPHAKNTCQNASCALTSCDQGYSDCNGNPKDGCEVTTGTDVANCGACGNQCAQGLACINSSCTCQNCILPNAKTKCVNLQCQFDQCLPGYTNCDNDTKNGCEVSTGTDPSNCGACGNVCPKNLPGCANGMCINGWFPVGVQTNVPANMLAGWQECYRDQYGNNGTPLMNIQNMCPGSKLMLACSQKANPNTLTVLAWAPRADVLFDTGMGNVAHDANGVSWYYNSSYSWGFAGMGDGLSRSSCDTANVNPQNRLCWHTGNGNINGGWRCGASTGLNGDNTWDRVVYQFP